MTKPYRICAFNKMEDLETRVNELIEEGYVPHGPLVTIMNWYISGYFIQVMYKNPVTN